MSFIRIIKLIGRGFSKIKRMTGELAGDRGEGHVEKSRESESASAVKLDEDVKVSCRGLSKVMS
jgi:hypothetical protein